MTLLLASALVALQLASVCLSQSQSQSPTGLTAYPLCAARHIAGDLHNTPSCLPPNADCMCYLDVFNVESIAVDIASHCNASDVEDTAAIMQANCRVLSQTPAVNSEGFTNLAFYLKYDTNTPSPSTIYLNTIPGVANPTTTSDVQSIIYVTNSGVTIIPSQGPTGTQTTSVGPVSFSPTTASTAASALLTTTSRSVAGISSAIKHATDARRFPFYCSVGTMMLMSSLF